VTVGGGGLHHFSTNSCSGHCTSKPVHVQRSRSIAAILLNPAHLQETHCSRRDYTHKNLPKIAMTTSQSQPPRPLRRLRILIVRHGETQENVSGIIQGQLDTPLNSFGQLQAATTADFLSTYRLDRIITSPLRRARDTAQAILSRQSDIHDIQLEQDERLKEKGFGVLEGKPYLDPKTKRESIDGIEKTSDLHERLAQFWNDLITFPVPPQAQAHTSPEQQPAQPEADREHIIALVSHGAAISALLNGILLSGGYIELLPDVQVSRFANCSVTHLLVPTTLDRRNLSTSRELPDAPRLMKQWVVKPPHLRQPEKVLNTPGAADRGGAVMLDPNGDMALHDLGFGTGVGHVVVWAETAHLRGLIKPEEEQSQVPKVNVDELVGK
jgi:broad specificity phosphatase PhoE